MRRKVHSGDAAHGLKLNLYPAGRTSSLFFDNPQAIGKAEEGEDHHTDFEQAGTYEFQCNGIHHGRMKRKWIVES